MQILNNEFNSEGQKYYLWTNFVSNCFWMNCYLGAGARQVTPARQNDLDKSKYTCSFSHVYKPARIDIHNFTRRQWIILKLYKSKLLAINGNENKTWNLNRLNSTEYCFAICNSSSYTSIPKLKIFVVDCLCDIVYVKRRWRCLTCQNVAQIICV